MELDVHDALGSLDRVVDLANQVALLLFIFLLFSLKYEFDIQIQMQKFFKAIRALL